MRAAGNEQRVIVAVIRARNVARSIQTAQRFSFGIQYLQIFVDRQATNRGKQARHALNGEKRRLFCSELARSFGLTPREEEVLVLLALGKKPTQIEQELFVAASTVKTHTKHIYQKFDIHSRKELFDLVGIDMEREAVRQP